MKDVPFMSIVSLILTFIFVVLKGMSLITLSWWWIVVPAFPIIISLFFLILSIFLFCAGFFIMITTAIVVAILELFK